jgi:hypothetical protein
MRHGGKLLSAAAAAALMSLAPAPAYAQRTSCADLWHQRNSIYASFGYCFQSQRAVAVFGRGCFAPFGRLPPDAAREVRRIQQQEARRRCPA